MRQRRTKPVTSCTVISAVSVAIVLAMSSLAFSGLYPRYELPHDGHPGRVHIQEYFSIEDPHEAARLLLQESALARVDIDRQWKTSMPEPAIPFGSGPMEPDRRDRRVVDQADSLVAAGKSDQLILCVIQVSRYPTIREFADLMNSGVRFYRCLSDFAFVVRARTATLSALSKRELVIWIGDLTPDLKYKHDQRFAPDRLLRVYTLVGDTPECRRDLAAIGGEIRLSCQASRVAVRTLHTS